MAEYNELLVQKFEAVFQTIGNQDVNTSFDTIQREFPDPEEEKAFGDWVYAGLDARLAEQDGPGITAEEFVKQVDSANFLDGNIITQLIPAIQKNIRPCIPIGFDGDTIYRLDPEVFGLWAQPRDDDPEPDDPFLGINSTVQPREPARPANRRQANLSEMSACSAESDDANVPGFVFSQLGELQYATRRDHQQGWPDDDDDKANKELHWMPSGFNLVARLSSSARTDGIFAIYNMFPRDDFDWKRHQITHPFWGIPPTTPIDGDEQFSCAKLGQHLSEFGKGHRVVWMDRIEHPVELVRVTRSGDGRVLRATVDEKFLWSGRREGSGSSTETGSEY
ncbi:hypothetical protein C8A00DRAFT_17552 [Chaetomidium leptoderma]|uniref:Uncharacterized protein n=1 Tax=Chaetomidium leptoderma TaxID=669021 RepID=A0AAN6VGR8_9PEZI|nr:hypothetical protein C8A00DRAFT_17552 [Chaetomidium leptoderma]